MSSATKSDVEALIGALTVEQKVSLLAGDDIWNTVALPGVPRLRVSDGPAGVRGTSWNGPASACVPCGTALGATFDAGLVEEIGRVIGREARSKSAQVVLAPTVNLHRTPIGGRNFECMSEDPELTAVISSAYIRGVQSQGVGCCVKHFVGNDTEYDRHNISSVVDEVTLREAYLVPFERAVAGIAAGGGSTRSVMTAYNRLNGTHMSHHEPLLRGVLRDEWGFDGVVISDWFGAHEVVGDLVAGLDLEMPGPPRVRGERLLAAVRAGDVAESFVDDSVRRLLELIAWSGAASSDGSETTDDSDETRATIRAAAIASMVLLKNDGVLPLGAGARVAVLGPNADRGEVQGGGSARVRANRPSMPLQALADRGVSVAHAPGCRINKRLRTMRGSFQVQFTDTSGSTAEVDSDSLNLVWFSQPAEGIDGAFRARIDGRWTPAVDGEWQIGLSVVGTCQLRIDGDVVIDVPEALRGGAFFGLGSSELRRSIQCRAGVAVHVEVDVGFVEQAQVRGITIGAEPVLDDKAMDVAVDTAAAADVAVVVVGTNADWETEGEDRTTLDLPGEQNELVRRVAAVNPRTVVVVNAGSPVTMPWLDEVAAVVMVWFPGEEFGDALADVLLGDAEPGGRLPISFPYRLEDTPAFAHYPGTGEETVYGEGLLIGHRWYDAAGHRPMFAFGHGLGYTSWAVEAATTTPADDGAEVTVVLHNDGERAGSTVVQVYVEPPEASAGEGRPVRTLRGFARVSAAAGAHCTAVVRLPRRAFSRWSSDAHDWVVDPGAHRVVVGLSSDPEALLPAGVCEAGDHG